MRYCKDYSKRVCEKTSDGELPDDMRVTVKAVYNAEA